MAEDPTLGKPLAEAGGFDDAAKHNAEIAAKLAAQDISGQSMAPVEDVSAGDALDALAKQHDEHAADIVEKKDELPVRSAEELASDETAKKLADAEAEAKAAAQKRADEFFKDSPSLPPGASHKSSESFAAIKIKAAQEISARESELEKLRADKAKLEQQLQNQAPPEALKELEDHRAWRAKLDVESDPKFKEYDKSIASTREFIYAQLKRSPAITDEVIAEIKKHGGPENVQMERIFKAVNDPALQRTVEAKIADIEQAKYNKNVAIDAAKANISEYVAERSKVATQNLTAHNDATAKHLEEMTKTLTWYNDKLIDSKADAATRKEAEAHNAFVAETKKQVAVALTDDSPQMRAIMIAATAQLIYLQRVHEGSEGKIKTLEKSIADITAKYDKLRGGSTTRLRESVELAGGKTITAKPGDEFKKSAGESLDDIAKQVMEERARASAAGTR